MTEADKEFLRFEGFTDFEIEHNDSNYKEFDHYDSFIAGYKTKEVKSNYVIKQLENELKFAREMTISKHKQIKDLQEELAVLKAHMRG